MIKLPVSVCMIARDEEKYIEKNLRQLSRYGVEIIVVDTGSRDHTREIAKKYTDKVYDFTWENDFSAARNYAASKSTNHWILVLDCDECLMQLDVQELRKCMQQHSKHVGMLKLYNQHTQDTGEKSYALDEVPRFYNRNFYEYRFSIHEQITPKNCQQLEEVKLLTFPLPAKAEHYGYDISPEEMRRKQERNLLLLEAAVEKDTAMKDYLYFQTGQSYFALGEYEHAKEAYKKALDLNQNFEMGFMKQAVLAYAATLDKMGRYEEELQHLLCYESQMKGAGFTYMLGVAYQKNKENIKALLTLVKVTQMADMDTLGENAYDTFVRILHLHSALGNREGLLHFKQRLEQYGLAHGRRIVFE